MAKGSLPGEERHDLLRDLSGLASDADLDGASPLSTFLPLARHRRALDAENLLIRGGRGVGKTALFRFINEASKHEGLVSRLFPGLDLESVTWVEGFGQSTQHPDKTVLDQFADESQDDGLRMFWMAHLVCRLFKEGVYTVAPPEPLWTRWREGRSDPAAWTNAARGSLAKLSQWLDGMDEHLRHSDRRVFVSYDYLDQLGLLSSRIRNRFTASLLALWMSLVGRYRNLRPKIFIREDLFQAGQEAFPDASKLHSRSMSLDWTVEALYRMVLRHMAARSEAMRQWIGATSRRIPLTQDDPLGWLPPEHLPESGLPSQKSFIDHLVQEKMGKGVKKGYTYRWIPNRLQDAHVSIAPRSLLTLLARAAENALQNPMARYHRLITPNELVDALAHTSKARVTELKEEHPVVARLENLRGLAVMLDPKVVIKKLSQPVTSGANHKIDGFDDDGRRVLTQLVQLGVLGKRSDGRIDVPDIYRYGFDIRRKGGVARPV
ncbi:MAG: hypothetical protein JRH20_20940 [Deltaproteobacteria bacterium]|nr:hypothetical protein [Deltaproteobacteria bacterium]